MKQKQLSIGLTDVLPLKLNRKENLSKKFLSNHDVNARALQKVLL